MTVSSLVQMLLFLPSSRIEIVTLFLRNLSATPHWTYVILKVGVSWLIGQDSYKNEKYPKVQHLAVDSVIKSISKTNFDLWKFYFFINELPLPQQQVESDNLKNQFESFNQQHEHFDWKNI